MGWIDAGAEFAGSFAAAFLETRTKLKLKEEMNNKITDYCPEETIELISKTLSDCSPSSTDLTWWGRKTLKLQLDKNSYFGSLLAIDGNAKSKKRVLCIIALKTASKCICSGYDTDVIRAATYSYLALRD